jgi:hypothetical protein
LELPGHEEERKTKEDLEEVSYGRGTERRKDVEGDEEMIIIFWEMIIIIVTAVETSNLTEMKRLAADRSRWKSFVAALCSYTGDNRK